MTRSASIGVAAASEGAQPQTSLLFGCDFSSAPRRAKPIVTALGRLVGNKHVQLTALVRHTSLAEWAAWLAVPDAAWLGGFDLPFGLPRELVETLGWPADWSACMDHYARLTRPEIRSTFANFCNARPVGGKFAHRATDVPAGSSPSMKWVNPPVAWMLHAGVPVLRAAGARLVGVGDEDQDQHHEVTAAPRARIALEAYPGLLAREVLGRRSYKSDDRAKQTSDRLIARKDLLAALERGERTAGVPLFIGLSLKASPLLLDQLSTNASGDALDAVLCLMQAAWSLRQHLAGLPRYGLPDDVDPLEGWIVTAQRESSGP